MTPGKKTQIFGAIIWFSKIYVLQKYMQIFKVIKENLKTEGMHLLNECFIIVWLYWSLAIITWKHQKHYWIVELEMWLLSHRVAR